MNLYYSNNLTLEKTENLALLGKNINKIFYTSKIKKQNIPKIKLSTLGAPNIPDCSKIICKEINLYFCSTQKNKTLVVKDEYKAKKLKKSEDEKNCFNIIKKGKKNNKLLNKSNSKVIQMNKKIKKIFHLLDLCLSKKPKKKKIFL